MQHACMDIVYHVHTVILEESIYTNDIIILS